MTAVSDPQSVAALVAEANDNRVNHDFDTQGMTHNNGPHHPATHGTLRIIARLDGEQVISAEPMCGYMHRGYEKLTEVRTYPQINALINRIDWLGSFANEVPFILAAEKLMDVEAPPRAQWIRTILFEMSRVANISLFLGDFGLQLGGMTAGFYAFRDREWVLNQIESATGGRFHPNFDRIGGLKDDLPKGWIEESHTAMDKLLAFCDEMEDLLVGNEIFQGRTRGIGVIPAEIALSYGLSGANLRASGVDWDLRRDNCPPGLVYDKADWKVWTHPDGDCFARTWVRLQETREAAKIVKQLLDTIPSGPVMAKVPRIIKVPAGEAYVATENPLGEMGYYVVSKGDLVPSASRSVRRRSTIFPYCRGWPGARMFPTSSRSSAVCISFWVTSTDDTSPCLVRAAVLALDPYQGSRHQRSGAYYCSDSRHGLLVQDHVVDAEPSWSARSRPARNTAASC